MQFVFLKNTGEVLFIRNDAMTAQWTVEEMSLSADFPYLEDKKIVQGYWVAFQWEGAWQFFEVKNAKCLEPNHFQQITAESLAISELTDEHIDEGKWDNISAQNALQTALNGTLWAIGNVSSSPVSSADIARGSVWQAVNSIKENWNVYIEPRFTFENGNIGRFLDILPTGGEFNGLRLSVDKNLTDTTVTWDDSNVITAIKGYGTTINEQEGEQTVSHVLTFADAVWEQTADHPAKPLGDVWLVDPEATALYGRNGRPRRGFYQNTSIEDANVLLLKSWETLKNSNTPDLQIEGTVTDLRRLGYADEPIRLHDIAIVEIKPSGLLVQKEIIRLTVDLLNPANTTPTIGNYIPNIIYINRKTNESATGSKGGGGRGKGQTEIENDFYTNINANKYFIQLEAGYREEGDDKLHSEIVVTASEIRLEVKNVDSQLRSTISQTASQIRAEVANTSSGLYSTITQTASQIRSEVSESNSTIYSTITQTASQIRSEVANTSSGIYSSITQTASQIRSEVSESNSTIYTTISQTASQIRSEVANTSSGIYSSITQTASQIRSEVAESDSTIYSSIEQTSSQIRSEVANTSSSLSSSIQQNADRIGLVVTQKDGQDVVDAASIVLGINGQTGSYVQIQAAKINLDGYVTASQLNATDAKIENLKNGTATANWIRTGALNCSGNFYLGGSYVSSTSKTVVTGVDFTNKTVTTTDISFLHN